MLTLTWDYNTIFTYLRYYMCRTCALLMYLAVICSTKKGFSISQPPSPTTMLFYSPLHPMEITFNDVTLPLH